MTEISEKDLFEKCGPIYLAHVDWSKPDDRKTIAASLVKGVYLLEKDREVQRVGHEAIASIWWKFFEFEKIQDLKDKHDNSIFGAVFEYKPRFRHNKPIHTTPESLPPKYVIAFRGTSLDYSTALRDMYLDLKIIVNQLPKSIRFITSLEAVQARVSEVGPHNVWLTGHSLGAAIALQVGKTMARKNSCIETYLFNPPYTSLPIEKLDNKYAKELLRLSSSIVTTLASTVLKHISRSTTEESDSFTKLTSWTPYLFVNRNDFISCEYIGYFEHWQRMESSCSGLAHVEKIAARQSFITLILLALGKSCEPLHLIPSAFVIKNLDPSKKTLKLSHGLQQWWLPKPNFETKVYQFA